MSLSLTLFSDAFNSEKSVITQQHRQQQQQQNMLHILFPILHTHIDNKYTQERDKHEEETNVALQNII